VALGVLQYAVKTKWDDYNIEALQYADKYSLELVKDAD
jgi:hypothetical protein